MSVVKILVRSTLVLGVLGVLAIAAIYISVRSDLPSVESLKTIQLQTPMQIFSKEGELISQFGEKRRIPLTLDEMPGQMINAILATEDNRFYQHFGIDPIGLMRAISGQIMGVNKGGASTITMQVARNFFLTREVTYIRKIKEIFISLHIESLLTKDEILTLYLNKIELGHRAFGVGAAAQVYYGKDINELTLAQIAVIAGLPKAPSTLNPIRSPKRAKARRAVVLQRMFESGYITQAELDEASAAPITGKRHGAEITLDAPYIAEMVHQEMLTRYGREDAYNRGFKVYTTVAKSQQLAAQQALINNLHRYDERHGYRGAVKSLWTAPLIEAEEETAEQLAQTTSADNPENSDNQEANDTLLAIDTLSEDDLAASHRPDIETILSALKSYRHYNDIDVAAVWKVNEQSLDILLKNGERAVIAWDNLSWARPYVDDERQGPAPKLASEIVSEGDVIWVRKLDEFNYRLSQIPKASSALVSVSPYNGAMLAAVGGYSFKLSQFNRVNQAKRQVGSNIKPFIYSSALANGMTLASLINDAPINQWDKRQGVAWRPKNSPARYDGPTRLRIALAQSKNVVSVRLLRSVGLGKIIDHLSGFGFAPDELPRNESLALGSASLTPLEVATGFATFANGGRLVTPYLIERIEDPFGNLVYQATPEVACIDCSLSPVETGDDSELPDLKTANEESELKLAEQVVPPQNAYLVTQMLNSAIWDTNDGFGSWWRGTGWRAKALKRRDIAGKTGTTNDAKDAWFSGYNPHIATTVWIGFDDHKRNLGRTSYNANLGKNQITGGEAGATSALPAWVEYMSTALTDVPVTQFEQPEGIVSVRIDRATGKLSRKTDKTTQFEYFVAGTEPKQYADEDLSREILNQSEADTDELF